MTSGTAGQMVVNAMMPPTFNVSVHSAQWATP